MNIEQIEKEYKKYWDDEVSIKCTSERMRECSFNFIKNTVIKEVLKECLHSNQIEIEGVTMTYTATEDSIKKLAKDKYNIDL